MSEALYVVLAHAGDLRLHFPLYLAIHALALTACLAAVPLARGLGSGPRTLALVLVPALVFRLTQLGLGEPSLSGDVHRYLWDGVVLGRGLNPYRFAPAAPERAEFSALAMRVNHPAIATVYPPIAECAFALAAWISPSERAVRALLVLGDALIVLALLALLRAHGREEGECLLWAWCPLAVTETALGGHVDSLAIGLFLLGLLYLSEGRKNLSTWLFAASALVKLLALAAALALVSRLGWRRTIGVFAVTAIAYVPFLAGGTNPFTGLAAYAARWQFNAPVFTAVVATLEAVDATDRLKAGVTWARSRLANPPGLERAYAHVYPQEVARMLVGFAFVLIVLGLARARGEPERLAGLLVLAFLVLTPTLHPWYALWGVAFAPLLASEALFALAGLVPLAYLAVASEARGPFSGESPWVVAAEFLPFVWFLTRDLRAGRFSGLEA